MPGRKRTEEQREADRAEVAALLHKGYRVTEIARLVGRSYQLVQFEIWVITAEWRARQIDLLEEWCTRELDEVEHLKRTYWEAYERGLKTQVTTQASVSRVAQGVTERVARREKQGGSGAGKSSVISSVLNPLVEDLAPLPIPVAIEDPIVATSPVAFAGHLVRTVARYVAHAHPAAAEEARERARRTTRTVQGPRRERAGRLSLAPSWLGLRVELTTELRSVSEQAAMDRPGQEVIEEAQAILQTVAAHGLRPVIVLDDTDKWLQVPGLPDPAAHLGGFFSQVPRLLAEQLSVSAVLAVHERYLDLSAYDASRGFLDATVHVPALPDRGALERVLAHRTKGWVPAPMAELITEPALDSLMAHYRFGRARDLRRRVLFVAHTALARACDEGADVIAYRHVELAISECAPDER